MNGSLQHDLRDARVPVVVVAGFLGSGKTTLLNRLLNNPQGQRMAVMVNDFGSINIDSQLVSSAEQNRIDLSNGCICCTIESDLIQQLQRLLTDTPAAPDVILIETSGVSEPGKVISTLKYPQFRDQLRVETVVSLMDAANFSELTSEMKHLAMNQVSVADVIVLNKVDLVSNAQIARLHRDWLFPGARVYETAFANVPRSLLMEPCADGFSSAVSLGEDPEVAATEKTCQQHRDHSDQFFTFSWQTDGELSLPDVRQWFKALPTCVYRAKGILKLHGMPKSWCQIQLVGSRLEVSPVPDHIENSEHERSTQLVLISWTPLDAQALTDQLNACLINDSSDITRKNS
ncbi:GTP-binding protein [Aestuariicella sp. G3-2]|uniref:CobW family GTP-binding protein n=1 Tax=Pseudomaricurvus albidus TaxID=2842452 RepID=UPI001C0B0E33|nr:GTP-binding protein [Aestuariicella albida]MBU3068449.1 GTP-binding protein [Aestuariicella albida]